MQVGVTVPITEFGADLIGLRDFVQAAEDLRYAHIRLLDHVVVSRGGHVSLAERGLV